MIRTEILFTQAGSSGRQDDYMIVINRVRAIVTFDDATVLPLCHSTIPLPDENQLTQVNTLRTKSTLTAMKTSVAVYNRFSWL